MTNNKKLQGDPLVHEHDDWVFVSYARDVPPFNLVTMWAHLPSDVEREGKKTQYTGTH